MARAGIKVDDAGEGERGLAVMLMKISFHAPGSG